MCLSGRAGGEGRGDADEDGVGGVEVGEEGGGFEAVGSCCFDFGRGDAVDIAAASVEGGYFFGVDVEAGDAVAGFREEKSQGEADVAEADDGDVGFAGGDAG